MRRARSFGERGLDVTHLFVRGSAVSLFNAPFRKCVEQSDKFIPAVSTVEFHHLAQVPLVIAVIAVIRGQTRSQSFPEGTVRPLIFTRRIYGRRACRRASIRYFDDSYNSRPNRSGDWTRGGPRGLGPPGIRLMPGSCYSLPSRTVQIPLSRARRAFYRRVTRAAAGG